MNEEGASPDDRDSDARPIRVFISYASEDDEHRNSLEKYLKPLQREGVVETWHDRKILPGGRWGTEIDEQLELADLILCLVSADFLASDYCWDIELFEPGGEPVEEALRVEAGEALGAAGDPRLSDESALRVLIPGGAFWMGAQSSDPEGRNYDLEARDNESLVHRVTVSDLWVARFPVTVQQFAAFLEAGDSGYLSLRHWNPQGWAWREGEIAPNRASGRFSAPIAIGP